MKKIIALALTLVLVLSMSVTVFAEEILQSGYTGPEKMASDPQNVTITIAGTSANSKVYYVEVKWDTLAFTYTFATGATWDPTQHTYTNNNTGSWSDPKTITVINHSNDNVTITATPQAAANNNGVTITASVANSALNSAVGTAVAEAPKTEVTVSVSGTPVDLDAQDTVVGTVVIAFSHN